MKTYRPMIILVSPCLKYNSCFAIFMSGELLVLQETRVNACYIIKCMIIGKIGHMSISPLLPLSQVRLPYSWALDGGPQCRMSNLRNGNVACPCRLFSAMSHVEFKKRQCPMTLQFLAPVACH